MRKALCRGLLLAQTIALLILAGGESMAETKRVTAGSSQALAGNWQCRMSINGIPLGNGVFSFTADGLADIGGQSYRYRLLPGAVLRLEGAGGQHDYDYALSGDALNMRYNDGSVFDCTRALAGVAPSPRELGQASAGSGNEWQLQGGYCHTGGSSDYASSYSRLEYINFDGRGRWTQGGQSSFSSGAGQYAGSGAEASGSYRVQGDRILYQTRYGEQGVAQVNMQQNDGRITEIMLDGKLYAASLCE